MSPNFLIFLPCLFFFSLRSTFCETGSTTTRKCKCLWPFSLHDASRFPPFPSCCEGSDPSSFSSPLVTASFFQPWARHPVQGGIGVVISQRSCHIPPLLQNVHLDPYLPLPARCPSENCYPVPPSDGLLFLLQLQNSWEGQSHRALEVDGAVLGKALPPACVLALCIPALGPPGQCRLPMQTPVWNVRAVLVRSQYSA